MMSWLEARGEHGGDVAVHVGGVWVLTPANFCPPSPLQTPMGHMCPRDTAAAGGKELWAQPKPRSGFLTYFWGRHMGKVPFPPYCPQSKRDLQPLVPAPLSGQLPGRQLPRPSLLPPWPPRANPARHFQELQFSFRP